VTGWNLITVALVINFFSGDRSNPLAPNPSPREVNGELAGP
jgi:hypothetical protein